MKAKKSFIGSNRGSYMERRRREKNKKAFVTPPNMDAHYLRFPNERLGNNYALNWEFVKVGLPPQGTNAFRNLHDRHLAMYCNGKAGMLIGLSRSLFFLLLFYYLVCNIPLLPLFYPNLLSCSCFFFPHQSHV
jgi:hypothetical protein